MASKQQREISVLGALAVVLAALLVWQFWPAASAPAAGTGRGSGATLAPSARRPADEVVAAPPHVDLEALAASRVVPARTGRNPFRVAEARAPSPVMPEMRPSLPSVSAPGSGLPPAPPPPPPIPLKFIGVLTAAGSVGRVAVLSDGKFVYHGREGDVIDGRYRVVRIGEESLQIEYVDGRGRQMLRMSGA
jgi:hypothetical protein